MAIALSGRKDIQYPTCDTMMRWGNTPDPREQSRPSMLVTLQEDGEEQS